MKCANCGTEINVIEIYIDGNPRHLCLDCYDMTIAFAEHLKKRLNIE